MSHSTKYDYIIAGAGSSGLSLAWHMIHPGLKDRRILIVDRDLTPKNDKTWGFWSDGSHPFDHIIYKKWRHGEVFVNGEHFKDTLAEYPYQCVRSGDYRNHIIDELKTCSNVTLLESTADTLNGNENEAILTTKGNTYSAEYIFQSCIPSSLKKPPRYPLIQHFWGWEITANADVFDPESFTLMDFDDTLPEIAFMYILPWSKNRALLEYTIFSTSVKPAAEYEKKLELYLYNKYKLRRIDYHIDRTEFGEIPMEDTIYDPWYAPRVLNLGNRGGLTKPSTGYAYLRIHEHSRNIVENLITTGKPAIPSRSARFRNYDLWLLQIMHDYPKDALKVFHALFKNNSFDDIFRFLGEDSDFSQDLKIMLSVPSWPFFRAIWKTKARMFIPHL